MGKKIIALLVIILSPFIFIFCILAYWAFFPDKPATKEKIIEVINLEFKNETDLDKSYVEVIELVDFLDMHKMEILGNLKKNGAESDCAYLLPDQTILPDNLTEKFKFILSKQAYRNMSIQVCYNGRITLGLTKRTDYENFLYIEHLLYIGDRKNENSFDACKEKIIQGKYHFVVKISDAFDVIDPNNFAPN